uniref:Ferredoxin n=1 Tax=Burkholderia sp. JS667 TaxID=622617 RepID=C3UVE1_9BURK|nr:ferredoxin [Burkholderia sp. JS667]
MQATAVLGPSSVCVVQTGETYACSPGESLLRGMLRLGRKGIPVGCVNGGCGVCKVRVLRGAVRKLGPISRAHVSADEEDQGYALACRVAPDGDVELEVAGRLKKPFFCGAACADAPVFKK